MAIKPDTTREEAIRRLSTAQEMCSDVLGYVQAAQQDPKLYDMVFDLLAVIDGRSVEMDRRKHLLQETAEYIANVLIPNHDGPWTNVITGQDVMPRTVADVKEALLAGRVWISWMDDRVTAAMRQLHGEPTGDAALFANPA